MNLFLNILMKLSSSFITMLCLFYSGKLLLGMTNKSLNIKKLIMMFAFSFILILNYYLINEFFRVVTIILVISIFFKLIFNINIKNAVVLSVFSEFLVILSEMIFAFAVVIIFKMDSNSIVATQFGGFISNLLIFLIAIIFSSLKIVRRIYKFLDSSVQKINENHIIIVSFLVMIIINILGAMLYYDIEFNHLLIFNTFLIFFSFYIVYTSFKNKINYIDVNNKYNTSLNSLKEYELILNKYKIVNHENKNQLLTIRNMSKNKKINSYIDELIDNNQKDNDLLLREVSVIPEGGLRGLIYSKLLYIKENNINYNLNVSKQIKVSYLINIENSLMLDICKILGVFIDNAIDEVNKLKEKNIEIDFFIDGDMLNISVSNNYKGIIELEKIDKNGYTTKGKGHGYGLPLVKEILKSNKNLYNERFISKETFTQILKIKM